MGPTTINGLPAHALLVHAVVVLVPLTAIAVLAVVLCPPINRRLGIITPGLALVTLAFIPLTTHAGEWLLAHRRHVSPLLHHHAELGDQLMYWSAPVFVAATIWWMITTPAMIARVHARVPTVAEAATSTPTRIFVAVIAIVAAIGSVIWVYRIGDSGAQSVWGHGG